MVSFLYLLFALTPFLAISPWVKWLGIPTGIIYGGLVGLLVIGTLIRQPELFRWNRIRQTPVVIPLLVFLAANLLSTSRTVVSGGVKAVHLSNLQDLVYLLFATVFYWVIVNSIESRQKVNQSLQAFVLGAAAASLYGLVEFFKNVAVTKSSAFDLTSFRLYGTADEPQVFGGFLIIILPLLAAAVLFKLNFSRPLFYYLGAAILLLALTATFSAGALAGFGMAVILLLLFIPYYNFRQLVSFLLIFVLVGSFIFVLSKAAFPGYLSGFKALTYKYTAQIPSFDKLRDKGDTSIDGTYQAMQKSASPSNAVENKYLPSVRSKVERSWFREALWNMFKSSPVLGVGPGNFGSLYKTFRSPGSEIPPYVPKPHNQYLEILAETGIIGALAFAWVVLSAAYTLYKGWQAAGRDDCKLLVGMAASIAAVGVHGYSFGILVHIQIWVMLALAVALALVSGRRRKEFMN